MIIYNNFTSQNQKLIKNTRLETPEGLIFRIGESISIPGKKTENGKNIPGQIEIAVYADSAGDEYNIGLTDFTLPGFKNDPARYKSFYARSKTKMEGGFSGVIKTISKVELESMKDVLEENLKKSLASQFELEKKNDFIAVKNSGIFKCY